MLAAIGRSLTVDADILGPSVVAVFISCAAVLFLVQLVQFVSKNHDVIWRLPVPIRATLYAVGILAFVLFGLPWAFAFALLIFLGVDVGLRFINPKRVIAYEPGIHEYHAVRTYIDTLGPAEVAFVGSSQTREGILAGDVRRILETNGVKNVEVANYGVAGMRPTASIKSSTASPVIHARVRSSSTASRPATSAAGRGTGRASRPSGASPTGTRTMTKTRGRSRACCPR